MFPKMTKKDDRMIRQREEGEKKIEGSFEEEGKKRNERKSGSSSKCFPPPLFF